ncbi:hypothetical protein GCM10018773_28260 [Streptomyces candidus]|nr:hypothetical protein GCM10018773_28260 [Streptomyces candidus]
MATQGRRGDSAAGEHAPRAVSEAEGEMGVPTQSSPFRYVLLAGPGDFAGGLVRGEAAGQARLLG